MHSRGKSAPRWKTFLSSQSSALPPRRPHVLTLEHSAAAHFLAGRHARAPRSEEASNRHHQPGGYAPEGGVTAPLLVSSQPWSGSFPPPSRDDLLRRASTGAGAAAAPCAGEGGGFGGCGSGGGGLTSTPSCPPFRRPFPRRPWRWRCARDCPSDQTKSFAQKTFRKESPSARGNFRSYAMGRGGGCGCGCAVRSTDWPSRHEPPKPPPPPPLPAAPRDLTHGWRPGRASAASSTL